MTAENQAQLSEKEFREFANKLLAAEVSGFKRGVPLYSPESLQMVMKSFCEIVAETLKTQSCTIQLKSYDILNVTDEPTVKKRAAADPMLAMLLKDPKTSITEKLGVVEDWYRDARDDEGPGQTRAQYRKELAIAGLMYPHAIYPKGVVKLVASNHNSPWEACVGWSLTSLEAGITTQIVQGKAARVRDKLEIRETRSFNKLGPLDPIIWNNRGEDGASPLFFYNYYGVPIRIHQRGEVIGILRVENKGLFLAEKGGVISDGREASNSVKLHGLINEFLGHEFDIEAPLTLLSEMWQKLTNLGRKVSDLGFKIPPPSIFGAIYLAFDITAEAAAGGASAARLSDLCCQSYPFANESKRSSSKNITSVDGKRPPIQVMFGSLSEEQRFVEAIPSLRQKKSGDGSEKLLKRAAHFYESLNDFLAVSRTLSGRRQGTGCICDQITEGIMATLRTDTPWKVEVKVPSLPDAPDFLYEVSIQKKRNQQFLFYIQVVPSGSEISHVTKGPRTDSFADFWRLSLAKVSLYKKAASRRSDQSATLRGVRFRIDDSYVIHFPSDRLAARVQALTYILPVPDFTMDDAWKLSWAAVELGKLVERHISYRGNSLSDPIPLTAIDFYRIPISDMSFVDALQRQKVQADTVVGMLHYHVPTLCRTMGFIDKLEYSPRIKKYRQYFERLGTVHSAHFDSVMAIWLTFLSIHLRKTDGVREVQNLKRYADIVASAVDESIGPICTHARFSDYVASEIADRHWEVQPYADVLFLAPPMEFDTDGGGPLVDEALSTLARNLRNSPSFPDKWKIAQPASEEEPLSDEEIYFGIFLTYDRFINFATSLYGQIINQKQWKEDGEAISYVKLYRACSCVGTKLRRALQKWSMEGVGPSIPARSDEKESETIGIDLKLVNALMGAKAEILALSTTNFAKLLNRTRHNDVYSAATSSQLGYYRVHARLTVLGVYKRLRTMVNISGDQLPPSLLNWDTLRFDYVGYRVNCLFKNQVFAVYERLWSGGDPFLYRTPSGPSVKRPIGRETSRQRWLCLATRIHDGEDGYYAWQIRALMDPHAVDEGYWGRRLFTLNKVRQYMAAAHSHWHPAAARRYLNLETRREGWRRDYVSWFAAARSAMSDERQDAPPEAKQFGVYLCQEATNTLIRRLSQGATPPQDTPEPTSLPSLRKLLDNLETFLYEANEYSKAWRTFVVSGDSESPTVSKTLRQAAIEVCSMTTGKQPEAFSEDEQRRRPIVYVTEDLSRKFSDIKTAYLGTHEVEGIVWDSIRLQLVEFQRMQKEYLFFLWSTDTNQNRRTDDSDSEHLRSGANVLSKVLCYSAMFAESTAAGKKTAVRVRNGPHEHWTAYDLFYYLVSLIPVEFQVRTSLSNTMAEQYHSIYKEDVSAAPEQQERLREIGQKLEQLDCETEVIYENYVTKRSIAKGERN